jgi:hypothetical protein
LQRTSLLLHIIDIAPYSEAKSPAKDIAKDAKAIANELKKYDDTLYAKPRWVVFNKADLVSDEEATMRAHTIIQALKFSGPAFLISALRSDGLDALKFAIMEHVQALRPKVTHASQIIDVTEIDGVAVSRSGKTVAQEEREAKRQSDLTKGSTAIHDPRKVKRQSEGVPAKTDVVKSLKKAGKKATTKIVAEKVAEKIAAEKKAAVKKTSAKTVAVKKVATKKVATKTAVKKVVAKKK